MRQHDEAERQHPEAEDGQEAEQAAENQRDAEADASEPRSREWNADGAYDKLARAGVYAETTGLFARFATAIFCGSAWIGHPQEMVKRQNNTREMNFFEKIAWQIGKAFVLAHSHRAKRYSLVAQR
ncbi:hypothetical protein RRH01S_28_00120 [Rhizobium rhizogenes NBRC 13257]|uniref:Uncharacterized protein n=1 Tax=Rhizobium rhizogenes NBRC 13257 TaxID=1220581 RepID=A0AA87QGR8_RHIRH|nr:hypothetical protein RRH01S_28_00120 [Rhizobium rhizogenes NBRC 13257]